MARLAQARAHRHPTATSSTSAASSASTDPATADPAHAWFTFEKGATKSTGGQGWADVWRKGCFGWEYKSFGRPLDPAFDQLLRYAGALENPPLLIVSDMDRILVRTNWTNTVQETHTLALDDLLDATRRDLLRAAFTDPDRLKPKKTRDALTAEAASKFSTLAFAPARTRPPPETVARSSSTASSSACSPRT